MVGLGPVDWGGGYRRAEDEGGGDHELVCHWIDWRERQNERERKAKGLRGVTWGKEDAMSHDRECARFEALFAEAVPSRVWMPHTIFVDAAHTNTDTDTGNHKQVHGGKLHTRGTMG